MEWCRSMTTRHMEAGNGYANEAQVVVCCVHVSAFPFQVPGRYSRGTHCRLLTPTCVTYHDIGLGPAVQQWFLGKGTES